MNGLLSCKLATSRLLLRPFQPADAAALSHIAGDRAIADTMISIPYPYPREQAIASIETQSSELRGGRAFHFAMTLLSGQFLIGSISLRDIEREHSQAELSFWVGKPWWGRGYAKEAGAAVVGFGFDDVDLNRIYAHHMIRNPAAGAVMRALGMRREGLLRERVRKWGVFEDVALCAVLRRDWEACRAQ